MTKILLTIIGCATLCSCASGYTQIYQVNTVSPVIKKNSTYVFDNDTIQVTYDLWADGGKMDFTLTNKSEKPIYIDWKRSSFVFNERKSDYYIDKTTTRTTESGASITLPLYVYSGTGRASGFGSASTSVSNEVMVKDERVTFIPPHSTISRRTYRLMTGYAKMKSLNDTSIDGKSAKVMNYPNGTSPYRWRNFLTYSFTEDCKQEYYVDNAFYVDKVIAMKWSHFHGKPLSAIAEERTVWEYPYASPTTFFSTQMPRQEIK